MKKINAIIVSVTMLVAGLNFYFANCDAQSDFDLSMADVEYIAQGGWESVHVGETKTGEKPKGKVCGTCGFHNIWCRSDGRKECTPEICAHLWGKLVENGDI